MYMLLISAVLRYPVVLILPLETFIEIATWRMSFIILGTVLILPLGLCDETATGRSMYLDYNHIQIATGRINLF